MVACNKSQILLLNPLIYGAAYDCVLRNIYLNGPSQYFIVHLHSFCDFPVATSFGFIRGVFWT